MSSKILVACAVAALLAVFAAGRYSVSPSKTETKESSREQDSSQTHSTTTTTVVELPSGEKHTTTVVDATSTSESDKKIKTTVKEVKAAPPTRRMTNVSALVAYDFVNRGAPTYGISVTREIMGPLTVGAFGLNNGTVGVSIGLNF